MMGAMDENPKTRRRGGFAAGSLIALFALYVFSSGPAVTMLGATGPHPAALFAFKVLYSPLALLLAVAPKSWDDAAMRWLMLWDFYGVF